MTSPNAKRWEKLRSRVKTSAVSSRLRRSRSYGRLKLLLKRIAGQELWLRPAISPTLVQLSDWAIVPNLLNRETPIVYSFGIGDSIAFERLLIEKFHAEVHAFDPTPSVDCWLRATKIPDAFHFHPWAISSRDETLMLYPRRRRNGSAMTEMYTCVPQAGVDGDSLSVPSRRLSTLVTLLGHEKIDVLKMDIEGAEYDVLSDLIESQLRPAQILVEFHHRFDGIGKKETSRSISRLTKLGYVIAFVSETGREVTLVYLSPNSFHWTAERRLGETQETRTGQRIRPDHA